MGGEFDERTKRHESGECYYAGNQVEVLRSGGVIDEKVYRDGGVAGNKDENIAMSKMDFSRFVWSEACSIEMHDLSGFVQLFELLITAFDEGA